jgi:hypothetical protein
LKSNPPVALFALVTCLASDISAQSSRATIQVTVEKRAYGTKTTQPFYGVGTFDLLQGSTPLQGAACPNKSNAAGELTCIVPLD